MGFWTAIAVIAIVAIGTEFIVRIVKICTRHEENIERIKRGYPTIEGELPVDSEKAEAGEPAVRLQ